MLSSLSGATMTKRPTIQYAEFDAAKLAQFLKEYRTKKGLSVREFARELGLAHMVLYRLENQQVQAPTAQTLSQIAEYFPQLLRTPRK